MSIDKKKEEEIAKRAIKATCEVVSKDYITKEKAKEIIKEHSVELAVINDKAIDKAIKFGFVAGAITTSLVWLVLMWMFN